MFLPGDHVLDRNITVANVSRLIMRGESSSGNYTAKVVCSGLVGLIFTNMMKFKIQSLAFTDCGKTYPIPFDVLNSIIISLIRVPFTPSSRLTARHALLLQSTQYAELVNCSFRDNIGTALVVINSNITAENNDFTHNYCEPDECISGGGITALSSNLTFIGNTTFIGNIGIVAGAGIFMFNSALNSTGNFHFESNSNVHSLNISGVDGVNVGTMFAHTSSLHFNGTNNFTNNSAQSQNSSGCGGAICVVGDTSMSFTGTNNFINNSVNTEQSEHFSRGGAIFAFNNTSLSFTGTNIFINNSATAGGAIYADFNCMLSTTGTSNFSSNSAKHGGAIFLASDNNMTFDGNISFTNNGDSTSEANSIGGGMYLYTSTISIMPDTTVYWENNSASFGGAIYVVDQTNPFSFCSRIDNYIIITIECFYQLPGWDFPRNTRLVFRNNYAKQEGSDLYGGAINKCRLDSDPNDNMFDTIFEIEYGNKNSEIYPNPLRICPCQHNYPNCSNLEIYKTVYPGETFQVPVVAFGQQNTTFSAKVGSRVQNDSSSLDGFQYSQKINSNCTLLNFTVFSLLNSVLLQLYEEGACGTFGDLLNISLTINQTCPPGFNISEMTRSCVCEKRLQRFTNNCSITSGNITRDSNQQFWVRYDDQSDGLILHPNCPFDYCTSQNVSFSLSNTDVQCAYNRSGRLCGACKANYSLVLGTSHCEQCNDNHLSLLILFAVIGVALVFLLLVCKLTVATGTLSGLVFYANIVGSNRTIFLPEESPVLPVFIAWLNLDFGIEACFYNGMDAYTQTWLQFVFPVYLWVIVGLVIVVSNYSQRFAKLLGNNPVPILATLILLSYAKILRTSVAAINFTHLEYPDKQIRVWLHDANIDYLVGQHIPLFIVAMLVFLFLFLPYTLLLVFGQWLQAISHLRLFSWINRLKPFMDSYHAPYKAKHRYWPGLLLVLRIILLSAFAIEFNPQQNRTRINLLSILVVAGFLQLWAWISGGVYTNWCLDALEGSFSLNLIILASATYYVNRSEEDQLAVGYTSVSIALATFIGILTYHIFQQVRHTKLWKKVPKLNLKFNKVIKQAVNDLINHPEIPCEATPNTTVTHTEIDMRELRSPLNLVNTK